MNVVMIIPTGIGCKIGGHAGDATPSAKLLASVCDQLILHPNVVNASDINEAPANSLYVEGGLLDEFLEGKSRLVSPRQNRILVAVNPDVKPETINAVNAARTTIGADIQIIKLQTSLEMTAMINKNGTAGGTYSGVAALVSQVSRVDSKFDALAIATEIKCNRALVEGYFAGAMECSVNPWGAIEAVVSRFISKHLQKPTAHAPVQPEIVKDEDHEGKWDFVCDPRMAPEFISNCFLHCVLKGLHKAPEIVPNAPNFSLQGISVNDVDLLVSPSGCWGKPHELCRQRGIPILAVKDNSTIFGNYTPPDAIEVQNYLTAAGYVAAMSAGVTPLSTLSTTMPVEFLD